jgi:hypothetical protein
MHHSRHRKRAKRMFLADVSAMDLYVALAPLFQVEAIIDVP